MTNKAIDFYDIPKDFFSLSKYPDYCSFCGTFKRKMKNHMVAHKLRKRDRLNEAWSFY